MKLKNGKDLLIRKAEKEDAAELIAYLNKVGGESDNLLFGENEFGMTVEQEESFIESINNSPTSVLLAGEVDGKIICVGSIAAPRRERRAHQADLAMSVSKAFWGQGVGTHLMQSLIDFVKNTEKLEIIHLTVKADNARAIALYTKMGFKEIGVFPKDTKIDGKYYDAILMYLCL